MPGERRNRQGKTEKKIEPEPHGKHEVFTHHVSKKRGEVWGS